MFSFGPECDLNNLSKFVDPILSNFAPLNTIVCQMLPNSSTCLILSFQTSSPKIVRVTLACNLVLANLGSSARPWFRCRCRPRSCGAYSVPLVGSPILRGRIYLHWSKLGMSLYPLKRSPLENACVGSVLPQNCWSSPRVPARGLSCMRLWNPILNCWDDLINFHHEPYTLVPCTSTMNHT